jgi:indolepyruvate ferredoxin oxidoreductase
MRLTPMTDINLNNKFSLEDKYTLLEGRIILSGIQALVRLLLDQNRADLIKGLNTGTLVSGYRGSPVGVLDINLLKNKKLLDQHNINFHSRCQRRSWSNPYLWQPNGWNGV